MRVVQNLVRGKTSIGGQISGEGATVWDGEVSGMAEALEQGPRDRGILMLAVKKVGRTSKARTGELSG